MISVQVNKKIIVKVFDVNPPHGYAMLVAKPVTHEISYEVVEPELSEREKEILKKIRGFMVETIDVLMSEIGSREEAEEFLKKRLRDIVKQYHIRVDERELDKLAYYIIRDYLGFGKIDVMMRDPLIEDISCNGVGIPIYVWHREYESIPTNVVFETAEELDSFIIRLAYRTGRMISMARPMLDAVLPDGSRIQMTLGTTVTKHGSTFTIRKFRADPLTIVDMINYNTVSSEMAAFLWFLVENKCSVFVCGGVASGKTTMLNCFSSFIKPDAKIVTIEDTPEVQLYHKNWIRSVTRPASGATGEITLFDLLKMAVRQRPDYIIVGEVRGEEAYTLFQAMATGHLGMATMHAESVSAAIHRLESKPMNIPRPLISELDIITVQARLEKDGKPIRRTLTVTEVVGLDPRTNEIITNEIFKYDPKTDSYRYLGRSYILEKTAKEIGKPMGEVKRDIEMRKTVLEWMARNGIRSFKDVTAVIRDFEANPEEVYKMAKVGSL